MLGKLLKHEFHATAGQFGLVALGLVGFAALSRLFLLLGNVADFFTVPYGLATFAYFVMLIAALILVSVIIIRRFYMNTYGDEGYLTLTLPVKRRTIIFSKLIVSSVWLLACYVVMTVSLAIAFWSADVFDWMSEFFMYLPMVADRFVSMMGVSVPALTVVCVVIMLISVVMTPLSYFAAVSFGQLFAKHRFIGSVLGYLLIGAARQILMTIYSFTTVNIFSDAMNALSYGRSLTGMQTFGLGVSAVVYLLLDALICVLLFMMTNVIMKRAVNLQ